MARRFSQLFVLPSRSDNPTPFPSGVDSNVPQSEEISPKKGRKRDTVKGFATLLFSRGRPSTSPRPSPPPKDLPAVKVARALPLIPLEPPPSRHDSGIGSEKSSIKSLPVQPNQSTLPAEHYRQLQILIQTLETLLGKQDAMSHSLSKNLLSLMAVKELHIKTNRRLQQDWKVGLIKEMNTVRDELRAIFAKKATLQRRTLALVAKLAADGASCVDVEVILDRMKRDMICQGILSEGIIDALTRKCWKSRWVKSTNQGLEMKRFVGFLVERVSRLHALSREVKDVMAEVQSLMVRAEAC